MAKIAVERPFTDVKLLLKSKGYEAEMLDNKADASSYDCCVVRDLEDMTDYQMNVPLVAARGRTVSEIINEVEERLERIGEIRGLDQGDSKKISGKSIAAGVAAGTVVGAAAGFLLAPKSGKELREDVSDKTKTAKEKASSISDTVKEKTSTAKDKISEQSNKIKDKVNEMKNKAESKKDSNQEEGSEPIQSETTVAMENNGESATLVKKEGSNTSK
ncbi:YkuS family protein [Pseudalkalibacillus caeni]|nr:YkuS family protein [Pseudalkalibacillus caeni]